jgi:ADP-ribose pyrophosphatase
MLPVPPIIGRREVAGNRFFKTIAEELSTPDGTYTYNFIESTWDAVIVVPVLSDGRLVVERIYRHPYRAFLHEFPAGGIDHNEDPLAAGARELEEETGWRAARLRPLGSYLPLPGLVKMRMHVVLAEELEQQGTRSHEALELIEVEECTLAQAWAYAEGPQASAFLLQGLLLYERFLRAGRGPDGRGAGR